MQKQPVTVIGLGPMGHAMASTYIDHGHRVTVWNRTASRADDLVAKGAVLASSPAEALSASGLVVLSLTDYDAMYAILEPATHALSGKVVVNLSSDTPEKAREAAKWAARHGAEYLTGGVQASPTGIGDPESFSFYSGPQQVFESVKETLEVLTKTDYRGEDPGLAALYYQLQLDVFWTAALAYLHALAVADAHGISAQDMLPYLSGTVGSMPDFFAFYTPRIDAGEHPGDVDRLAMGVASVDHVVQTAKDAGVDAALPEAVLEIFRRGVDAGHAADSFTSLIETFRKPTA
ncbi:6-phosphogluconate dehydrogenase [Streptomyces phaeoluteigriseus]|uniref:6-phosphogluconate dehydrogenase n=1 Tax=Streptomyces phaeoluteigriseus TaxID=114686 RepID=A0A1V6MN07_9ACTN|nr:NAD(P)-binding domain-containing protein [Streptomyces phaeoluteigriseus]OQD53880.1 6-phosphogluconate dehydrogenase [Streptomyces phaeoluteigriseus]